MEKKKTLIIIILAFVLLLGGAGVLYSELSSKVVTDPLLIEENAGQSSVEHETGEAEFMEKPATETREDGEGTKAESTEITAETTTETGEEETAELEKVTAPDFIVYDIEGNEVRLYDYIGKPIVLNFWASWCGPCQMEMPDFNEKYQELGKSIQFLMINMTDGYRETVEIASEFIAEKGYVFPVYYDKDSDAASTYGAYSLPTTYFIDANGNAVAQATGAIDAATLQRGIDMITNQ